MNSLELNADLFSRPWDMQLVLVGGFGISISVRGMGPGIPPKLKQLLHALCKALKMHLGVPWNKSTNFGFRNGHEPQIC